MARCCTRYFRCGCCDECTACCLWPAERQIRATADRLFDTVNQDDTCCGCKDEVLNKTEVMLLMRMLQDEGRDTLRQHRGLIGEIVNQLRAKTAADSEGGTDVTRDEMRDVPSPPPHLRPLHLLHLTPTPTPIPPPPGPVERDEPLPVHGRGCDRGRAAARLRESGRRVHARRTDHGARPHGAQRARAPRAAVGAVRVAVRESGRCHSRLRACSKETCPSSRTGFVYRRTGVIKSGKCPELSRRGAAGLW